MSEEFDIPAHPNQYEILEYGDFVESYIETYSSTPNHHNKRNKESVSRNKPKVRVNKRESSDSREWYTTDGKLANKEIVKKYLKQVKESKGFKIVDYPGHIKDVTDIVPRQDVIDNRNKCPEDYDKIMDMAASAIERYNNEHQDAKFKVANIKKLNVSVGDGETNYITFSAVKVEGGAENQSRGSGLLTNTQIIMTTLSYWMCLLCLSTRTQSLKAKLKKLKSPQNLKASRREKAYERYKTFQAKV